MINGALKANWKNAGQTPAAKVCDRIGWCLADGPLPGSFDFPMEANPEGSDSLALGPNQTFASISIEPVTLAEIGAVSAGQKRIYVWSSVDYFDAFGAARRTEVAVHLKIIPLDSGEHHFKFDAIGPHNGVDEDCMYPSDKSKPDHLSASLWKRWLGALGRHGSAPQSAPPT